MNFKLRFKPEKAKAKQSIALDISYFKDLFEIGKRLIAITDINDLLNLSIDFLIEKTRAERGLIILFGEDGQEQFQTARNLYKTDLENPNFEISHTIINNIRLNHLPVFYQNAMEDPDLLKSKSVYSLKLLSVIGIPLIHHEKVFGVIYLDNRTLSGVFIENIYKFACEFGNYISLAALKALEQKKLTNNIAALETKLRQQYKLEEIIGHHPKMVKIMKLVSQVANTNSTVLIQGESGTGKDVIARALFYNCSLRKPYFIRIDCGAFSEHLLESELFGHVRGAFTSSIKNRIGWFEKADKATIFLDEVNNTSLALQAKLLRVIESGEFAPLGSTEIKKVDVRIIAASSQPLSELIRQGKFREELYYRLNTVEIDLPALRERRSDIPLLVHHFLEKIMKENNKENLVLAPETEQMLFTYNYPGNVRELRNCIERAVILVEDSLIEPNHLTENIRKQCQSVGDMPISSFKIAKQKVVETFEKQYIQNCLKSSKGNITQAAQIAQINIKNFHQKMKKYHIEAFHFKSA